MGWLNIYSFSSSEFSEITCSDDHIYETPFLALKNAKNSNFKLSKNGLVNFYIVDSPCVDNQGGISLLVTRISE